LLTTSEDAIELKERGLCMRVDEMARNICQALPDATHVKPVQELVNLRHFRE
jgi:hypothetical protein